MRRRSEIKLVLAAVDTEVGKFQFIENHVMSPVP